jgi:L-arabinose transport system ATP-binding protein
MDGYLQFKGISKQFPGVQALDDVSLSVKEGSIHGLVGENGAGKSTLLKILSGAYTPTKGSIFIGGKEVQFKSPKSARDSGVAVIYQELNLVPDMSVAENLLLGHLPAKHGFIQTSMLDIIAAQQLTSLLEDIDPHTIIKNLAIAQRQMIEIGKALLLYAKIIAFDEPTSSLSEKEKEQLFTIIRSLKKQGCVVIYVSHLLNEIFELCDSVSVFRDGKLIKTFEDVRFVNNDILVRKMVGRSIVDIYGYTSRKRGETVLEVKDLKGPGIQRPISFFVKSGEVLGFYGLVGSGRSELMRIIYGLSEKESGSIFLNGKEVFIKSPGNALVSGIVLCPEDKMREGIIPMRDVNENINITVRKHFVKFGIFLDQVKERQNATDFIGELKIKTPSLEQLVGNLSGGNQQKVILARILSIETKVIIMDEPTRGIDVGTKSEIYRLIYKLAESGKAIILVSSELPEVLGISDRVIIMRDGQKVTELDRADVSEKKVLNFALPVNSKQNTIY